MNKENLEIEQTFKLAYENHQKGNFDLAESLYKKIIKIHKKKFEVFFLLGSLYLQKRDFKEAINLLSKAIEIEPKHANSYLNLGYAFTELGEFEKAKLALDKAIEIQPQHADAHFNLANVYKQIRNFEKAKMYYEKTIQIQPKHVSALNNLANVYKRLGEFPQAISSYNKAIAIKPDHARAYHNLGNTYNQLGESSKAISAFRKAFEIQPSNLESLYSWSDLDEKILDSELKKKIKYIMEKGKITKKAMSYGNFLLSKFELRERNFEKELEYLLAGHKNYYEANKTAFDKGINYWLKNLPKIKELEKINKSEINNNIKPIFIMGVPRCGSTLVEKVIASGVNKIPMGEECGVISFFVGDLILAEQSFDSNIENLKNKIEKKYEELGLLKKNSENIFTDKTLDNFFFLGIIKNIFPKAKIINCKRNPLSSIISILKNNLGDISWAHNLENIFSYFDIYHKKINTFKENFPNFIYDLNFESFQNNPETESKKLMEFCDLSWDKKCLEFYKRKDIISFTASNQQIRNPIYKVSLEKYQPYKYFFHKYAKKYEWFK